MKLSNEWLLFVCILALFALVYTLTFPQHAVYGDENSYLMLGQDILEGKYHEGMGDRAPMLPLIISGFYAMGLDPFGVKFIVPLLIGALFLFSVFMLGKGLCKRPFIPLLVVLSFPFFWKWVPFVLVDVLLGVFASLSALYLYKGIKDDERYITYSMLFLALAMLTKVSAIVLVVAFIIYLFMTKRMSVLMHKPFIKGLIIILLIVVPAAVLTSMASGTTGFHTQFMSMDYFRVPYYYFLNFAMVPWSLLFLFGVYNILKDKSIENGHTFSLLVFLVGFAFFSMLLWKEMRFLLFVIPFFAITVERSLVSFKKVHAYAVLSVFFIAGIVLSMLLLSTVSYVSWGGDELTRDLISLQEGSTIAVDSIFLYNKALTERAIYIPANATPEWIRASGAEYLSLSLYGEIGRNPDMSYYKPKIGPIDASLIESGNPKMILSWWPGYKFSSPLYEWAESSLSVHRRIQWEGQDVFVIYEVI